VTAETFPSNVNGRSFESIKNVLGVCGRRAIREIRTKRHVINVPGGADFNFVRDDVNRSGNSSISPTKNGRLYAAYYKPND